MVTPMHSGRENGVNARAAPGDGVAAPSERGRHPARPVRSPGRQLMMMNLSATKSFAVFPAASCAVRRTVTS